MMAIPVFRFSHARPFLTTLFGLSHPGSSGSWKTSRYVPSRSAFSPRIRVRIAADASVAMRIAEPSGHAHRCGA